MARRSRRGRDFDAEREAEAHAAPVADDDRDHGDDDGAREGDDRPSRTARKNASTELQKLGEGLIELRPVKLARLDLPERLLDAIAEAKRIPSFGAKRRQAQFIGKLMRKLDAESLDAIRAVLDDPQ
jgi:ribosomal 50S subunit-associated protein YjgA (DUF615 family)